MKLARRVAGAVLRMLPDGVRGRILPGPYRYRVDEIPAPFELPDGRIRLLIAPANFAGQGRQWARAVERNIPGAVARNLMEVTSAGFRHPADLTVPRGVYAASARWSRSLEDAVIDRVTHLLVEAEKPPFGAVLLDSTESQVRRVLAHGVRVGMICHGTDVRRPSRHLADEPDSPFADALADRAPELETIARANLALLARLALPVFVSTPDLLRDVPEATWLPVVVDVGRWAGGRVPWHRDRPVVVHAPSSAAVKGSDRVDVVLRSLHDRGLVDYRRLERVPFESMPDAYRDADIVLDQFRLGDYGVAACEAMAAGRIVVGHVGESTRSAVRAATGRDLPIVEARLDDLEQVLMRLLADPDGARRVAGEASEFVAAVHDGRRSADVLRSFLDD